MIFQVAKGQNQANPDISNSGLSLSYVKYLTLALLILCLDNTALANHVTLKKFNPIGNSDQDICGVSMADSVTGYIKSASSSQIFYLITITNTGTSRDSFNLSKTFISGVNLFVFIETVDGLSLTQSPGINSGGSYSFIVRFVTPVGTSPDTLNHTNVIATSLTCQTSGTTHITTHVYGGQPPTGDSCDLSIKKTANLNPVTVNDTLIYTITVINSLSGSAKGVFIIDTLPSSLEYITSSVSAPSTKYSLNYSSAANIIQFKYLTFLGLNQIITITIKVKVKCEAVPSVTNHSIVSSSSYDNNATNDNSSVTTSVNTNLSAPFATGITSCYNATAGLTATGVASGYGYRWYNVASGGTSLGTGSLYTTAALYTTATYYVAFYNLSSPVCEGPRTSVIVSVNEAPSITSSPSSVTICPNNNATFTVNANGPSLSYEWQVSTNNGSSWSILSNSATYAGTATSALTVANVSSDLNGFKYKCNVRSEGCTYFVGSSVATLTVRMPYTWLGVNTNWSDNQNWCQGVPDTSSDVTIPAGLSYYPVITDVAITNDLHIDDGASVTVCGDGILKIFGDITNYGIFDATNGTIELQGTASQNIAGSMFYNKTIKNLIVGNTSSSGLSVSNTLNDTLNILGTLSFGNVNAKLNTGDNITLKSTASGTAAIGIAGAGNSITGNVIVERYFNMGNEPGQHGKAWQFLATPTQGQTVWESWMENGNKSSTGYGTQITGTGTGLDAYSPMPALKYYDAATNTWIGITNTAIPVYYPNGYMLFVRGDRSISFPNMNNTTLRTKGTLTLGETPPITVHAGQFESVGNPYASPIDFTKINKSIGIDDTFYAWDPYISGYYNVGGYQTLSSVNNWRPVPGGSPLYSANVSNTTIQSGYAFFVHATTDSGSVSFSENAKVSQNDFSVAARKGGDNMVSVGRYKNRASTTDHKQFFAVSLFTGAGKNDIIADGNVVVFGNHFSNDFDGDDALKITAAGENFGLKRNGKILSIEARSPVAGSDTIYYNMSHLAQKTYQLRFAPENMESNGMEAFLVDQFLNTTTPVSLTDSTFVNITISSNVASAAADRFKVIFKVMAPLPLTFTSIKANRKNADILVEWEVENETNMKQYEVERSSDGIHFTKAATVAAANRESVEYSWLDENASAGYNYYRIKSIDINGQTSFTPVVKVLAAKKAPVITIYPNPISNGMINLYFTNQPKGMYHVRVISLSGQVMVSKTIDHKEGNSIETFTLSNTLSHGIYKVEITHPSGDVKVFEIVY
jgi:uncharacterized repeat protein (TIGR01451 family)